jgi:hypothetical protein
MIQPDLTRNGASPDVTSKKLEASVVLDMLRAPATCATVKADATIDHFHNPVTTEVRRLESVQRAGWSLKVLQYLIHSLSCGWTAMWAALLGFVAEVRSTRSSCAARLGHLFSPINTYGAPIPERC